MKKISLANLKISILLTFVFSCNSVIAQSDSVIYFLDKDYNSVNQNKAHYVAFGVKEKGLVRFNCYETATGVLRVRGWFSDVTLSTKEGLFTFYDSLGVEQSEGKFHDNKEEGYWVVWFDNHLTDSILYDKGEDIRKITYSYIDSNILYTRTLSDVREKIKEYTLWNNDGTISQYFRFVDGEGEWTHYYPSGKIKKVAIHTKGGVTETYYNELGGEISQKEAVANSKTELEKFQMQLDGLNKNKKLGTPSYPGGPAAFGGLFQNKLSTVAVTNPAQINSSGNSIYITFYLDSKGKAENIRITGAALGLQMSLHQVLKTMSPWDMKGHESYGPINYTINISRSDF